MAKKKKAAVPKKLEAMITAEDVVRFRNYAVHLKISRPQIAPIIRRLQPDLDALHRALQEEERLTNTD